MQAHMNVVSTEIQVVVMVAPVCADTDNQVGKNGITMHSSNLVRSRQST